MSTEPQDGDLGKYGSFLVRANTDGVWCDTSGHPVALQDDVKPIGERAIPLDVCIGAATLHRDLAYGHGAETIRAEAAEAADILYQRPEPPAPEYVRFGDWEPDEGDLEYFRTEIEATPYADVAAKLTIFVDAIEAQLNEGKVLRP